MVSSRCSSQTRGSGRTNTRKRRGRGASTVEVPIIIQPRNKMIDTSTVHTRLTCTAPPARPAPPHLGINRALANQTFSKFRVTDKITANRCTASWLAVSAFPPRGARPTTAFRGFMAARASNERAFAFGVSSDRSEGGGRHGPLADSCVCRRAFPSRVRPWCRKSAKNRYDARTHKFLVVSDKAELRGIPEGGVGRPNPQIRT